MKTFLTTLLMLISASMFSQNFVCEKLSADIKAWNELTNKKDNVKWANAIKNANLYKQNADGSFEYVYILTTTDSVDIKTLRNISFNYIGYYFPNLTNALMADMQTNSPEDGVVFKGRFSDLGSFTGLTEVNKIHGNVVFDIRFKPNRIRFSIKIQNYQVIKATSHGIAENYTTYVNNCYPLNPDSNHKKSYAMAFINANSNCMNFANRYLSYINSNLQEQQQQTTIEDW